MNRFRNTEENEMVKLANHYNELIELADLENTYVQGKTLQLNWGCGDRKVRLIVEDVLHLYLGGYLDKVIIGTTYGYICTRDHDKILKILKDREKQWKSMCVNCYYLRKRLLNENNLTIDDYLKKI